MRRFPLLRQAARLFLSHCISAKNLMPLTAPACRKCAIFSPRRAGAFWQMCRKRPSGRFGCADLTALAKRLHLVGSAAGLRLLAGADVPPLRSSSPLPYNASTTTRRWHGSVAGGRRHGHRHAHFYPARRPVLTRNFCARAPQLCRRRACRCTALSPATPCCAGRCTRVCPRWKPTAPLPPRWPLRTWR